MYGPQASFFSEALRHAGSVQRRLARLSTCFGVGGGLSPLIATSLLRRTGSYGHCVVDRRDGSGNNRVVFWLPRLHKDIHAEPDAGYVERAVLLLVGEILREDFRNSKFAFPSGACRWRSRLKKSLNCRPRSISVEIPDRPRAGNIIACPGASCSRTRKSYFLGAVKVKVGPVTMS